MVARIHLSQPVRAIGLTNNAIALHPARCFYLVLAIFMPDGNFEMNRHFSWLWYAVATKTWVKVNPLIRPGALGLVVEIRTISKTYRKDCQVGRLLPPLNVPGDLGAAALASGT